MATFDSPKEAVWDGLLQAGLVMEPRRYRSLRPEITTRGQSSLHHLRSAIGADVWDDGMACLGRPDPEADAVRVLGFGHALTEFAVAPTFLDPPMLQEVSDIGATANFIVATYDEFIDNGGVAPENLLPLPEVDGLGESNSTLSSIIDLFRLSSPAKLIRALVRNYHQRLLDLPHSHHRVAVRRQINQVIVEMYRAESATVGNVPGDATAKTLRRKSALPFVVIGLPAWLACESHDSGTYWRHWKWLYRLGEFVGRVDDAVDYEEDVLAGRPNVFSRQPGGSLGEDLPDSVAAVVSSGRLLLNQWSAATHLGENVSETGQEALRMCITSWFGGYQAGAVPFDEVSGNGSNRLKPFE